MKTGTVVAIFGAGGVGQTTLQKNLSRKYTGGFFKTGTNRPPRRGETAKDYNFYSPEEFEQHEANGEFLWSTPPAPDTGHRYCGELAELERALNQTGDYAFICILPSFHDEICRALADYRLIRIHLLAPAPHEHLARLRTRGDSEKSIVQKMDAAPQIDRAAIARNLEDPKFFLIEPTDPGRTLMKARAIMVHYSSQM